MAFANPPETINAIDPTGEKPQGKVIDREGKIHCFQYGPPLPATFSPCQTFAPLKSSFVLHGLVLPTPPSSKEGVSFLCGAAQRRDSSPTLWDCGESHWGWTDSIFNGSGQKHTPWNGPCHLAEADVVWRGKLLLPVFKGYRALVVCGFAFTHLVFIPKNSTLYSHFRWL